MTQQDRARLPAALLLLCLPGCLPLSGPQNVSGTVGGSLSVQCRYEEEYRGNKKYWCKSPCWSVKIVETTKTERELRSGHVSIRDDPANLTFTVTLESLTEDDEGTYECGISIPWKFDSTLQIRVSVSPAPQPTSPANIATGKTSTIKDKTTPASTALVTASDTPSGSNQQDLQQTQGHGLPLLLSLLALLLLLLAGTSLLAWRMVRRRIKIDENPELPQEPHQATQQSEPCYANLELQTWPLRGENAPPRQVEVEYSTVQTPSEEPFYSMVVFNTQNQDSKDDEIPSQRPPQEETQYSLIKKT